MIGCIFLILQKYISVDTNVQFVIFLAGLILLGIPHGAADLLVANQNAGSSDKPFSKVRFLGIYLSRLLLFAGLLWFFPTVGILLFVLFAGYHFGETDLYQFKTNTVLGKIFVLSYGIFILSVILLFHFNEVKEILQLFEAGKENKILIDLIERYRFYILSLAGILFFTFTFIYFLRNNSFDSNDKGQFLIHFAFILVILFNLPLLLGFTFYFVVWHSILSLKNIFLYLRINNRFSHRLIMKQIIIYSTLSLVGIAIFGLTGFMYVSKSAIISYMFVGLAILTAPHMQVMHDMYNGIRMKWIGKF